MAKKELNDDLFAGASISESGKKSKKKKKSKKGKNQRRVFLLTRQSC